jgi:integrase
MSNPTLSCTTEPLEVPREREPVVRRRFQRGCLVKEKDGRYYSMFYVDAPEGRTKQVKKFIGNSSDMSLRSAHREHALTMEEVNHARGSAPPLIKGQTFQDAITRWRSAVAPNLAPGTVRQRESYLRKHIVPRFGRSALAELDVHAIQQFATDLGKTLSHKSVVNILGTVFTIVAYAEKCGFRIRKVGFTDLKLGSNSVAADVPFFTRRQVTSIIDSAPEPFKTLFAVAWSTGLRAGEILALTLDDLDFERKTVRVNKSSDDRTRQIRQPKTPRSIAMLPMTTDLEAKLRDYIHSHWKPNTGQILFADRAGLRPRSRESVVVYGLHPVLKKIGIPCHNVGLHAFRHGLATELVEASAPLTVLQKQLRHTDIKTTLKLYAHSISQSQRDAMEQIGGFKTEATEGTSPRVVSYTRSR